jgi:hypothetical protein
MTDEEKIARLASILGVEGAVQYGRYHGLGERSDKKGHRKARLGIYEGDGPTDAMALRQLVCTMDRSAGFVPIVIRREAEVSRRDAENARRREASARAEAEKHEAAASRRSVEAEAVAALYAGYLADRGPDEANE